VTTSALTVKRGTNWNSIIRVSCSMTDGSSVSNNLGDFRVKSLLERKSSSILSDKAIHWSSSGTPLVAANGFSDMFTTQDTALCNIDIQCSVKQADCSSNYNSNAIQVDSSNSYRLTYAQNVDLGYESTVCIKCSFDTILQDGTKLETTSATDSLSVLQYSRCYNLIDPNPWYDMCLQYDTYSAGV